MLQAGSVLAPMRRGAQGRSGHAARRCPAPPDLRHLRRLLATGANRSVAGQSARRRRPSVRCPARPSAITRPGPQLAERARRAEPDPQHGLASIQRDLSHGWGRYWARCASMNVCIQPRYAARVMCAALSTVAKSTDRSRLAGPPPGDWLTKSTMCTGWIPAMMARSCGSRGSISPLRSCALAVAEALIWLFASSWASAVFLARSAVCAIGGTCGAAGIDQQDVDPGVPGAEAGDYGRGVDGGQPAAEMGSDRAGGDHQGRAERIIRPGPERQHVPGREARADQLRAYLGVA